MATANGNASDQSQDEAGTLSGQCPMQAMGIDIVPVRYAIDEEDENGLGRFGFPDKWQGRGIFQDVLDNSSYTLRQLRDGWLYVIADYDKTFHEYEVKGTDFIKYDLSSWKAELGETNRGQPGNTSPFLTYNQNNTLHLAWSKERWTWRLFNSVLENKDNCKQWMRKVSLNQYCQTLQASHMGSIKKIADSVADINDSASDDLLFIGHIAATAKSEDDDAETEIKPIAAKSTITSGIGDLDSACFVALDDPFTDLQDLSLALGREVLLYETIHEEKGYKFSLLEAAEQVTAMNAPQYLHHPESVKTDAEKDKYYSDLLGYYEYKYEYNELVKIMQRTLLGYTAIQNRMEKYSEKMKEIERRYGDVDFQSEEYFKRWKETKKWRDEIDTDALRADIFKFNKEDTPTIEVQLSAVNKFRSQLQSACIAFGWEPERGFVDTASIDGQNFLSEMHTFLIEAMNKAFDDKSILWMKAQFDKPTTIIPLYLAGYNKELYKKIQDISPEKTVYLTGNDYDDFANRFAELSALISTDIIQNSDFFKNLTKPLQDVMTAFSNAIEVLTESAISSISQKGASLFAISNNSNFTYFNIVAANLCHKSMIHANDSYIEQLRGIINQRDKISVRMHAIETAIEEAREHAEWLRDQSKKLSMPLGGHDAVGDMDSFDDLNAEKIRIEVLETKLAYEEIKLHNLYEETPSAFLVGKVKTEDYTRYFRQELSKGLEEGKNVAHAFKGYSGLGFFLFILNGYDLSLAMGSFLSKRVASKREKVEVAQKIGYTMNAFAAFFQGKYWHDATKDVAESFYSLKVKSALKEIEGEEAKTALRKFVRVTRYVTVLHLFAASTEIYYTFYYDIEEAEGVEKVLHWIKFGSLGVQVMASSAQLLSSTILAKYIAIGIFSSPWIAIFGVISGFAYIAVTIILNIIKKDDYQKWLRKLPWGKEPNPNWTLDNPEGVIDALVELYSMTMKPTLSMRKEVSILQSKHDYPAVKMKTNKIELKIELPYNVSKDYVGINIIQPKSLNVGDGIWIGKNKSIQLDHFNSLTELESELLVYRLDVDPSYGDFDIELKFYIDANKDSKLFKQVTYHYVFDYSMFNLSWSQIKPLSNAQLIEHTGVGKTASGMSQESLSVHDDMFLPYR